MQQVGLKTHMQKHASLNGIGCYFSEMYFFQNEYPQHNKGQQSTLVFYAGHFSPCICGGCFQLWVLDD